MAMSVPPDAFASVPEIGALYRSGATTPSAVVEAALARAARLEPRLNAVITTMGQAALAAAEAATRELRAGQDRGPLHGIPVAIKDIIDVTDVPTTFATRARPPFQPERDAVAVAHLRAAGAIPVFKTNLLEFAYGVAHPAIRQTNNPWDAARTSGGSSGGSAALVAAGVVPLAIGTDTGGSIRIPAAYCGIVGLKPSYGLVSTDGVYPLSWSLDHVGPLARTVRDVALLLDGLTGRASSLSTRPLRGLRIGLVTAHLASRLVTAGVRACVEAAVERLGRAGAVLIPVPLAAADLANDCLTTVLLPEAALVHEGVLAGRDGGYAPGTVVQVRAGAAVSGIDYVRAQRQRREIADAVERQFGHVDVLLSPSVAFVAPERDPAMDDPAGAGEVVSSGLANLTGHPALSLPCGLSEGLPVGLQVIGPAGRDADLLAAAAAVEDCLDGRSLRPSL